MNNIQISQLTLRKIIGILAIAFPFLLLLGSFTGGLVPILGSLSASYWSNNLVIFIGVLITFGLFLIAYKGYDKVDETITTIAGISMLGVILFPVVGGANYLFLFLSPGITQLLHGIFATIGFSMLGIMSYFQFTKCNPNKETSKQKEKRNLAYRICGIIIFAAIILMIPAKLFIITEIIRLFFCLESIVVMAFGFSWLVKGEGLLKD